MKLQERPYKHYSSDGECPSSTEESAKDEQFKARRAGYLPSKEEEKDMQSSDSNEKEVKDLIKNGNSRGTCFGIRLERERSEV